MADPAHKVLSCTCAHEHQDKIFGAGKRHMARTAKGAYRCSVCSKERNV